jgi:CRP-like cAMP-binding protein
MPHSLVQMLRGVPDFSPLDERSLLAIVGESLNLFWRAGSLIFEPGQPGDALYIILSGEVVIWAETGPTPFATASSSSCPSRRSW